MDFKVPSRLSSAFTLAEVILGFGLMAFALVALLSVVATSMRYNRQTLGHMNAVQIADAELNRTLIQVMSATPPAEQDRFWYDGDFTFPGRPFRTGQQELSGQVYRFAVYAVEIAGLGGTDNEVRRVDAYCWWTEPGQPGSKLTGSTRLINKGELP